MLPCVRLSKIVPVFAAFGLLLTVMLSTPLSQSASADKGGVPNGGNSANAKLCQQGGWQDLMNSNGVRFSSEGECVRSGAQGLGVEPYVPPTGTVDIVAERTFGDNRCEVYTFVSGWAPLTEYSYTSTVVDDGVTYGPFTTTVQTGEDGSYSYLNGWNLMNGRDTYTATFGGITVSETVSC